MMLLMLRILANLCTFFVERMCKHYDDNDKNYIIDQYHEKVLSFFYSFICAAIILLLIIESHKVMLDEEITGLSGTHTD